MARGKKAPTRKSSKRVADIGYANVNKLDKGTKKKGSIRAKTRSTASTRVSGRKGARKVTRARKSR